jgi:hypothetical protein
MHHEIEAPEAEESDLHASGPHPVALLNGLYLEAGLPLDLAIRAAIADYDLFEPEPART